MLGLGFGARAETVDGEEHDEGDDDKQAEQADEPVAAVAAVRRDTPFVDFLGSVLVPGVEKVGCGGCDPLVGVILVAGPEVVEVEVEVVV